MAYIPKLGDLVAARRHTKGGTKILIGMVVERVLIDWQVEWYNRDVDIDNPWYGIDDIQAMRDVYLQVRSELT